MEKFTLKLTHYTHPNCYFKVGRYGNGNLALQILSDEEFDGDLICTCSVNGKRKNPSFEIGIKNYSENAGMVEFLVEMGIIENTPVEVERSGWVLIPYYRLTKKGIDLYS